MSSQSSIPVLSMRGLEPAHLRTSLTLSEGLTLSEIVERVLPGLSDDERRGIRVSLVTTSGASEILPALWSKVRPRAGVHVVIRAVPGKSILRAILMIVVAIAAVALGQYWAVGLFGTTGALGLSTATWANIFAAGLTAIGQLAINALIPPDTASNKQDKTRYGISGWSNRLEPGQLFPIVMGKHRMAPYHFARPYLEVVEDKIYSRALMYFGVGRLSITDLKIGDTDFGDFDEIDYEIREGLASDAPVTLYPQQVVEESYSVELTRPYPRDDAGDVISGSTAEEKPLIRVSATDGKERCAILYFPSGLFSYNKKGQKGSMSVTVKIEERLLGTSTWLEVATLVFTEAINTPFWRAHRWSLATRGAYEVRFTRMTPENLNDKAQDKVNLQALQTFRPEYPVNTDVPLALLAMRIKATDQLNGQVDQVNAMVQRICPDWDADAQAWITRATRSPAAAYRFALEGPVTIDPVATSAIDLDALAEWSEWCKAKGLKYDRLDTTEAADWRTGLVDICRAGRASPWHDGVKWSVIVDRPTDLVVGEINGRNSSGFQWSKSYAPPPDAFRVSFADETNDYKLGERVVPWPGHTGDIVTTEEYSIPGKTDPDEIWREARFAQYQVIYGGGTYVATQDKLLHAATRGDRVVASYDTIDRTMTAARVAAVVGDIVVLDEFVEIEVDVSYGIRWRRITEDDTIGVSLVREVEGQVGLTKSVTLMRSGDVTDLNVPAVGDLCHFGRLVQDSIQSRVKATEGASGAITYHLISYDERIYTATDAEEPPAWDGRVGEDLGTPSEAPDAPRWVAVVSGLDATGDANGLQARLAPGSSPVIVGSYDVRHKLASAGSWAGTETCTAAARSVAIAGYTAGQTVMLQARATSIYDVVGDWNTAVTVTIGADDVPVPLVTSASVARLASGIRRYTWTTADSAVEINGYKLRCRPGTGWGWDNLDPLHTGLVTASPWETTSPMAPGTYTFGIVAVDIDGDMSASAKIWPATLGESYGADVLKQRVERSLAWPGTRSGGSVSGGDLVGGTSLPSAMSYSTPVIDLGADKAVIVSAVSYGLEGSETITMRTGLTADGDVTGGDVSLGSITARYVQVTIAVDNTDDRARLGDLVTLIMNQ